MKKMAVIFWSQTGNTEDMARAVAEGAAEIAEVSLLRVSECSAAQARNYDLLALGCPAMGDEILEPDEFEPFFTELESNLKGHRVALFGSYGWGDGEWMRQWEKRVIASGALLYEGRGLMQNEMPDKEALERCRTFGAGFARFE